MPVRISTVNSYIANAKNEVPGNAQVYLFIGLALENSDIADCVDCS